MSKFSKQSTLHALKLYLPIAVLSILAFVFAYQFVEPAPEPKLVISAGSQEGAYYRYAQDYAKVLEGHGIEVTVLTSHGSVENLARLRRGEVDIGFVQGGTTDDLLPDAPNKPSSGPGPLDEEVVDQMAIEPKELYSLGSTYFEPLWVFYRGDQTWEKFTDLTGQRLNSGPVGSGTRRLVDVLLRDNSIQDQVTRSELPDRDAVEALKRGELDAVALVAGPASPLIRELILSDGIKLMNMRRAPAYSRLHPYLSSLVLHEGMIDLQDNLPKQDVHLIAPTANLVAHGDVHEALVDLVMQAADEVHSKGGWFEAPGQFPAAEWLVASLHPSAKRFYKNGPPFLQRYLPFWAATMIDRLKVMLLPLIVILMPLFKIAPPLYGWRMRSRIYRWYKELEQVEAGLSICIEAQCLVPLDKDLNRIESEVTHIEVPLSYASQAYELRTHVELVRRRLEQLQGEMPEDEI